ncbi:hypothetical protein ACAF59_08895 [Klebsiella aerogenes]|uniref:hypothetical protein n=1 Tax=Klebsiella aerogenes TaxID=548 RepID=UPI002928728E|nr:hypothetical protein [Klebsiella aerogenes]
MTIYLRIVLTLVIAGGVYGLAVPALISMKDTVSVITGLALAILTPLCIYAITKGLFIETKDKK